MVAEKTIWLERAACRGATAVFFDDIWPGGGRDPLGEDTVETALATARAVCDRCPVRRQCLELALETETGMAAVNRFGLTAGFTPAQRWTLEKRAAMRCEQCGIVLDPTKIREGNYDCECGAFRTVAPIPDRGDPWSRRHTTLARRVLAFLVDGVGSGTPLPHPTPLSDSWGVHKTDMLRVYRALAEDSLIARNESNNEWVRTGEGVRHAMWQPPHLR